MLLNTQLLPSLKDYPADPYQLFDQWYQEALASKQFDPSPMILATVDAANRPDARIVLLKEYHPGEFIFYTHYTSPKAQQAEASGIVALNFYWQPAGRQIRIRGNIARTSREKSEEYFASRPRESQINTLASQQSHVLEDTTHFLKQIEQLAENANAALACPKTWGGYQVKPFEYEFFQAGDYRLNSRVKYQLDQHQWHKNLLYP